MNLSHVFLLIFVLFGGITENCIAQTMVPWLTRSADNSRSGWNPHETQLTQSSVDYSGDWRCPGYGGPAPHLAECEYFARPPRCASASVDG